MNQAVPTPIYSDPAFLSRISKAAAWCPLGASGIGVAESFQQPICETVARAAAARVEGSMYAIPEGRDAVAPLTRVRSRRSTSPRLETAAERAAFGSARLAAGAIAPRPVLPRWRVRPRLVRASA